MSRVGSTLILNESRNHKIIKQLGYGYKELELTDPVRVRPLH